MKNQPLNLLFDLAWRHMPAGYKSLIFKYIYIYIYKSEVKVVFCVMQHARKGPCFFFSFFFWNARGSLFIIERDFMFCGKGLGQFKDRKETDGGEL